MLVLGGFWDFFSAFLHLLLGIFEFMHNDYDLYYVDNLSTQACRNYSSLPFRTGFLDSLF